MLRKLAALIAAMMLLVGLAGPATAKSPPSGGGGGMVTMPGAAGMPPGMPPMKAFDRTKTEAAAKANVARGAVNNLEQLVSGTETMQPSTPSMRSSLVAPNLVAPNLALPAGCPTPSTTIVDYSGTCVGNYANSPLPITTSVPVVTSVGDPIIARQYATDDTVTSTSSGLYGQGQVLVVLPTPLPAGTLSDFKSWVQTGIAPALNSSGNSFNAYILHPTGNPGEYAIAFDSGLITVPAVADGMQTYPIAGSPAVAAGDLLAFYGQGIPLDLTGTDSYAYPVAAAPTSPFTLASLGPVASGRTYSFGADIVTGATTSASGGIRKFVDTLPGLGPTGANDLGQYIPVAVADTTTYPGSDYYEIAVVQYREQMHADLPPTLLRGYVQLSTAVVPGQGLALSNAMPDGTNVPILLPNGSPALSVDKPSYLGPVISAQRDRPVRILFRNLLPTGVAGDLFIPVDTSVMGSGMGPDGVNMYTQNRATLHLHGGLTPWISDGTPDQWTTPATEGTPYPKGVSTQNVPDMPDPGPGAMTFFYTNQQSARLMFYHDHAFGITRLNVYAGEAAGYLLSDPNEHALVSNGTIPADQIPLIIQDKTFVPSDAQLMAQDPTWKSVPGVPLSPDGTAQVGSLWFPHVYMPNQNPNDPALTGANAMGRWDYAEWFWPPYGGLLNNGSVANPLCGTDPTGLSCTTMPVVPGTPNTSLVPEGFMDTPVVNGTAYPVLNVDPKAYRFRILNAANDRSWNLSLYQAGSSNPMWNGTTLLDANAGEVPMVPANPDPKLPFPTSWTTASDGAGIRPDILDGRISGVPDPRNIGPSWVQIGTEGGVLPAATTIPPSPIGYQYNTRNIVVLNVTKHSLLLGPAERADVVVDFSQYAGKTLILYNDSGAPVPAFDLRNDYYSGDPDFTSQGGAPSTLPGYGPNTRTVMQIKVAPLAPAPAFDVAALSAAVPGLFAVTQDKPVVPQSAYNAAYGASYPNNYITKIGNTSQTFVNTSGTSVTLPLEPKAIQELFELNYGRMNATLGVELPFTNGGNQTTVPLGYSEPLTEVLKPSDLGTPVTGVGADGTQIWKITHNGVDTHAIHFHLFNVQVINRIGWDGAVRAPDANELGWKETVRMNPLEDAIVALRPVKPLLPFGVPDSVRLIDPTMPAGAVLPTIDPITGNPTTFINAVVNYGWEYVWHCHLLGHEENDMMRPIKFEVPSTPPAAPVLSFTRGSVILNWTDGTPKGLPLGDPSSEVGYTVWRALETNGTIGAYTKIAAPLANATTFTDSATNLTNPYDPLQTYDYQVFAWNAAAPLDANGVGGVGSNVRRVTPDPRTTTAVVSSANPSVFGQPVTFTATVTPVLSGLPNQPTGTMTWTVDGATSTSSVVGGIATLVTSTLALGSHTISAAYGGDTNFTASTSPAVTQVVSQAGSTTTTLSNLNPSTYGQNVTFTATVAATAPGAGTPTGTVQFLDGATSLGTITLAGGKANLSIATLTGGSHSITAVYSGDTNFSGSTSPALTQVVNTAPTTTVVVSSVNPSIQGQSVTFTATVSPSVATGSLQFNVDGVLGSAVNLVSGQATLVTTTLAVGSHPVFVVYGGDTNYAGSTSGTVTQVVGPSLRPTNTVVTSNRTPSSNYGQNITFTATVTPVTGTGVPTGTVQFSIDGANVGGAIALVAGGATFATATLPAGSHNIIATYSGSTVFAGGGSATCVQVVNKLNSATTITSNRNPASILGQSVTFTARVTPLAAIGSVQFSIDGVPTGAPVPLNATGRATLTTTTLTVGPHSIGAAFVPSTVNYNTSSATFSATVNKANSRTVVTTSGSPALQGTIVTFIATISAVAPGTGVPTGTVQFRIDGANVGSASTLNVSGQATYSTSTLTVGRHTVSAVYGGDAGFNTSTSANRSQRIR